MIAVKARFDGKQVIFPEGAEPPAGSEVIVVYGEGELTDEQEREFWLRASEETLRKVWDNPDDEIYDKL